MRLTRTVKMAAALVATALLGVSAASAVVGPSPPPTPQGPVARPGSDRIEQTAPDPGPGLRWAVRSYVSTSGGSCAEVGRLKSGRFGQVDAAQAFRETPAQEGGTCGDLRVEPVLLAVNHYPARAGPAARTVLFGQARSDVTDVVVTGPDGPQRRLVNGAGGGFILVLPGTVAPTDLPVRITLAGGEQRTFDWR